MAVRPTIVCVVSWVAVELFAAPAVAQRSSAIQLGGAAPAAGDRYGSAVAVDGDTLVIGAPADDVGENADQGSADVYRWTSSGWTHEATLTAADGAGGDSFGGSVAVSGDTVIVGALADDVGPNANAGSAYVFVRTGTTWSQQALLLADFGTSGDQFGFSVAVYGNTAVVGAPFDQVGAAVSQGSVHVFVRVGTSWAHQAQLLAADGAASADFGYAVAISADTALVGARGHHVLPNTDRGAAYVFTRTGNIWTQQAQLLASDGTTFDLFGSAVALDADTAVVGAIFDDVGANTNQGSSYVYVRSGGVWAEQAKLVAADGAASDQFGYSVAVSNDTVLVGSILDDVGAAVDQGSAYAFVRSGVAWTQQAQIVGPGGAAADRLGSAVGLFGDTAVLGAPTDDVGAAADGGTAWVYSRVGNKWIEPDFRLFASDGAMDNWFGTSVAISGDTIVVGAAGLASSGAYVFVRTNGVWTQQASLTPLGGLESDRFGVSVAISGDTALVGALGHNDGDGAAYVFVRAGSTWSQQQKLNSEPTAGDRFGVAVALSGDTALVGAFNDDVGASVDQGSARVFVRSGTTWTSQAQLLAPDGLAGDQFGSYVALVGDTALIGAPRDEVDSATNRGSAHVFVRSGVTWSHQAQLIASDGEAGDAFGRVALSGDTAVIGAPNDDVGPNAVQGSAYVFVRSGAAWSEQAQLLAADGSAGDLFGFSVAIAGDRVVVGATDNDIGANTNQGSAYLFARTGTQWIQQPALLAPDGTAMDELGGAVALAGDTLAVTAAFDTVAGVVRQGSGYVFQFAPEGHSVVENETQVRLYGSFEAALPPAQDGDVFSATPGAFATAGTVDTLSRALQLDSLGQIHTSPASVATLGATSSLNAAAGRRLELHGALHVLTGATASVAGEPFYLSGRATLTTHAGGALNANTPRAVLHGATIVESGAALSFGGAVEALGELGVTGGSLSADGPLVNRDNWSLSAATINASGGLTNTDEITFAAGASLVNGATHNCGSISIAASASVTFADNVINNGQIQVSPGGLATFEGEVSGAGAFPGGGSVSITGTLMPGASPAQVVFGGSLTVAASSSTEIEIGGPSPGSEHDQLVVGGTAALNGALTLKGINSFVPSSGASFTIIAAGSVSGTFSEVDFVGFPTDVSATLEYAPTSVTLHIGDLPVADVDVGVIYTKIPGHPTAAVPGLRDLGGAPVASDFRTMTNLAVSPDGSRWMLSGSSQLGSSLENVLVLGSGATGSAFAQEGQPIPGGAPGELYDFFSTGLGRFNTQNHFAYAARARGGVASVFQKVIVWNGVTQTIAFQMGDSYYTLHDLPPNPSGDELVGNSVTSIHLLNSGIIGSYDATVQNINSSRRPVTTYDRDLHLQVDVISLTALGGIGSATWGAIESNSFYTTPDGMHWMAEGDVNAPPTNPRVLVRDGVAVLQENEPVAGSGLLLGDISQSVLLANGDWLARGRDNSGTGTTPPDWAVRNGVLIAMTGDPVFAGATIDWGDTLYAVAGNTAGDYLIAGRSTGPEASNDMLVLNGSQIILREGDPVDVDGNGSFDDNAFIGRGVNTLAFMATSLLHLTDSGVVYAVVHLRDAAGNDLNSNPISGLPTAFVRIALGAEPPTCPGDRGDANCDGTIDFFDIDPFLLSLFNPAAYTAANCGGSLCAADIDCNGGVDFFDIDPFLTCLFSTCPPCP